MDVCFSCCNVALGTLDPRDFGMEHSGNEDGLLTLGKKRCKNIASGNAVAIGSWRLLRMISGCGRNRILYSSRCTPVFFVDRVKSCISFACES